LLLALASTVIPGAESHGTHWETSGTPEALSFEIHQNNISRFSSYLTGNITPPLMLFRDIIPVSSKNHTIHINTAWAICKYF
jgi:hypothetical protein